MPINVYTCIYIHTVQCTYNIYYLDTKFNYKISANSILDYTIYGHHFSNTKQFMHALIFNTYKTIVSYNKKG